MFEVEITIILREGFRMRQKKLVLLVGLFCLGLSGLASAAETIGVVNTREVLFNSVAGKKAKEELEKLKEKLTLQIKGSATELQKLGEEFKKQESVLTDSAKKDKQGEMESKYSKHQLLVKGADEEYRNKEDELVNPMLQEIQKIINKVAEKGKYALLLDSSSGIILYKGKAIEDLTSHVTEEFDKTYKAKK